jgi:hypothetical protein
VKLYHTTDAGKAILEKGLRDHSGSYGHILGMNDGPTGDDVLELTLPDDLGLDSWEIIEEDKRYRGVVRADGALEPVSPAADD